MAGIGDSWGTEEELLHPRGPNGRWISKAGIAKSIIGGVLDFLRSFRPRQFQSQGQATQYLHNIGGRSGHRMPRLDHVRLRQDLPHTNADLRDGVIDDPSTKKFVDMMDRNATELPDDAILTRTVGVDAFGFTPETATGTDENTDPGIRGMSGKLIADRGYGLHVIGEPTPGSAGPGRVRMIVAAKKGTKVVVPAATPDDPTIFTDRDQSLRVTRVVPDGQGGWNMYVTADSHGGHDVPEPIAGPVGPGKPQDREAEVRRLSGMQDKSQKVPDEQADQADEATRRQKAAEGQQILAQERAARDAQARQQPATGTPLQTSGPPPRQPGPGEPPPRTETIVHPALGGQAQPGAPAPTPATVPEAPATPRRVVDLRLAVRDAGIEAPSAGPKRKQFNDAYEGVISGKKDPIDAVRELDRDAADLDGQGDPDAKSFRDLSDVIKREYGLEQPAPAKKAAKKAAPSGMTPEQERAVVDRAKQFRGHERNEEETRIVRQADEILARREGTITPVKKAAPAKKAAKKAAPDQADLADEEMRRQLADEANAEFEGEAQLEKAIRAQGPAAKKAAPTGAPTTPEIKAWAKENGFEGRPGGWIYNDKGKAVAHGWQDFARDPGIAAKIKAARKAAPEAPAPVKKVAKKAAPEAPGDPLDKMTKPELLAIARQEGVQRASSMNKDQLKAGIKRMREIGPVEPGSSVGKENRVREILGTDKKPTAAELRAYAKEKGLTVGPRDRRDQLIDTILAPSPRERADALAGPGVIDRMAEDSAPVKKAAKAAVPGAAPGTAAGKITAGRLKVGDKILVTQNDAGDWFPSNRKTGQTTLTVESIGRGAGRTGFRRTTTRLVIKGRDENGNEITVVGVPGHQTFIAASAPGAAPKRMTIGEARRLSAMQAIKDNEITGSDGASWQNIARNVESGDWSIAQARKEAKSSARYFRESASTTRRAGTIGTPESREAAAVRQERLADRYDKLAEDLTISQSVTKTDKFMRPRAPAAKAVTRTEALDAVTRSTASNPASVRQALVGMPAEDRFPYLEDLVTPLNLTESRALAKGLGVRSAGRSEKPQIIQAIVTHFEGADDVEAIRRLEGAPDLEQVGRDQQAHIDRVKGYGKLAGEVEELIQNDAGNEALKSRIQATARREGIPEADIQPLMNAVDAANFDQARVEAQKLTDARGIHPIEHAGDVVPFDRTKHQGIGRGAIADGTLVHVVRPGYQMRVDGQDIRGDKATVEVATPDEARVAERARTLVPEGSVPGARADVPVDNAPRRKDLREAIKGADLPPASPGSGRKSQDEIKGDLVAGRITPEEAVRRFESEIAFTDEDLTEVDAHIRDGKASGDLNETELARLERHRAQLQATRESHVKHVEFLREHFKEEAPVHGLAEAKVQDPVSYEFLKDATPDDMREAAKQAGLDPPSGDTADEMFTDLIKQVARKELERRAAKKATKAAKKAVKKAAPEAPPTVPRERERVDAKLLAEGIDGLDDQTIAEIQRALDGDSVPGSGKNPTPRRISEWVDFKARGIESTTVIAHGNWGDPHADNPEREAERQRAYDLGMARVKALRDYAERIRGVRRRPAKKAAPAKAVPEVQAAEAKVDDLQKRIIDQALEGLQGAKSKDKGDDALEGLTLDELRRLADASGIPRHRTKRGLRNNILAHFFPEGGGSRTTEEHVAALQAMNSHEDVRAYLEGIKGPELDALAQHYDAPGRSAASKRAAIAEAEGFRITRPGAIGTSMGRAAAAPQAPTPEAPAAPSPKSLGVRIREAGIERPIDTLSGVDSAVGDADRRLKGGEDPTAVARFLRERAGQVAKADLHEEESRFKVSRDMESMKSLRKQSAEYLRRVATHVQQEKKAQAPAKKAPAKKATPPGADLARDLQVLARGTTKEERAGTDRPTPAKKAGAPSASRTGTSTVTGERSTAPEIKNDWGMLGTGGPVEFHADGAIGQGLRGMGEDRLMDVDGEPLSNVIGKLATRAVRGDISQDQLLDELKRLSARLPEGSAARRGVDGMIRDMDAPPRAPLDLPDWTPEPVTKLMQRLSEVPLSRGGNPRRQGRGGFNEMDTLRDLVKQAEERYPDGTSMAEVRRANWLEGQIRQKLLNHRHESEEGTFQINRSIVDAMRELEALVERLKKTPTPPAPAKKAARLTAIPGGRTGGPKKGTRPKLSVVRNPENGQFSITVVYEDEVS